MSLVDVHCERRYHPLGFVLGSWDMAPYPGILGFGPKVSPCFFPSEDTRQQPTDGDNHKRLHPKQTGAENQPKEVHEVRAVTGDCWRDRRWSVPKVPPIASEKCPPKRGFKESFRDMRISRLPLQSGMDPSPLVENSWRRPWLMVSTATLMVATAFLISKFRVDY